MAKRISRPTPKTRRLAAPGKPSTTGRAKRTSDGGVPPKGKGEDKVVDRGIDLDNPTGVRDVATLPVPDAPLDGMADGARG